MNFTEIENVLNETDLKENEEDILTEYIANELEAQEYEKYCLSYGFETETPSVMKQVSKHFTEKPCCSKNCCRIWDSNHLKKHSEDMQRLSRTEKKLVLLTILRNCAVNSESTRYSEQRRRLRFCFRYEPFGKMCASAFRLLFNIRIDEFKGLLAHLKTTGMSIVPPVHGNRGKKYYKANMLETKGVSKKVTEFMLKLGEEQGEFSSGRHVRTGDTFEDKDSDILWLPACFSYSVLFRMYNKQYPDFHISQTAFYLFLKNEQKLKHIKIRSPRSDMCDFCELQKRRIAGTKPHDESKTEELTAELAAHQNAYQGERAIYNTERKRAEEDRKKFKQGELKSDDCVDHISMDYGQAVGVPHTADQLGGTFYLHMRNFHLFTACSVLENNQIFYTYDEREAGKGSNEVISFLHNFLASREIKTPDIRIHADNCTGQNKNNYVIWYLIWLTVTGRVKHIELKFMIKGHTHFIADSGIGHAKREFRKSDVFCLKHWAKIIDRSAVTNKARIVDGNDVYDWKKGLTPYFKSLNGISKFQHFAADYNEPGCIWTKYGFDDDVWKKTNLLKTNKKTGAKKFKNLTGYLSSVGFKGGKPEKEKSLFENLRQYVKEDWKDEICPDPRTFKPPVRDYRPCPDWV